MSRIKNSSKSNVKFEETKMDFREIADQSLMGIAIIQDDVIKYVNPKLADLLEYSVEEMLNWGTEEYFKAVGPESIEFAKEQSSIKQKGLSGAVKNWIVQLKKKSGKLLFVENYSKTVMYQGRTANYVIMVDITNKLKAEQKVKYQAELVENISDAIISTDLDFNIISWNKAAVSIYGWKANEVIGKNIWDIFPYPVDDQESVLNQLFEDGFWKGESIQYRKDGILLNILISVSIIKDDENNPIGVVAINHDITERKRSELKLKESEEKYRKAYRSASLYKDLLTHDMNNIMQVIQSSSELILLFKGNTEKTSEYLERIDNSTNKAKRLIANINTISHIQSDLNLSLKNVDVLTSLNDAIKFTSDCFNGRDVHIMVFTLLKKVTVYANDLLVDVFENILNNAIKFNLNPKIEITIRIYEEQDDNNQFIKIEFIDNGIGISDNLKELIFQKSHKDTKGRKGLGFGLSVVKNLIKIYNGKSWVENRIRDDYSKGTRFILLLPKRE